MAALQRRPVHKRSDPAVSPLIATCFVAVAALALAVAAVRLSVGRRGSPLPDLAAGYSVYVSSAHSFSLLLPKEASVTSCSSAPGAAGSFVLVPDGDTAPVVAFETADGLAVTEKHFYVARGRQDSGVGGSEAPPSVFASCALVEARGLPPELNAGDVSTATAWRMTVVTVGDDAELERFIEREYGSACSLGARTPTEYAGTYDVEVTGQGTDVDTTDCYPGIVAVKYSPARHEAVTWKRGQTSSFTGPSGEPFDQEVAASFRFLP